MNLLDAAKFKKNPDTFTNKLNFFVHLQSVHKKFILEIER